MKTMTKKRGFTIVELVIVIAVIAILAAVLIPTFTGIIRKARRSADETAVSSMNTILKADGAVAPTSIYDLFEVLSENGIQAKDYTPLLKDHFFFWDKAENMIVYTNDQYVVEYPADAAELNLDKDNWITLSGEISTADVSVKTLLLANDNTVAEVDSAAELLALAEAINGGNRAVKDVDTIVIKDGTYNFMGAELFFGKGGDIKDLTIKADTGAVLKGIVNINANRDSENSDGTNDREYITGIISLVKGEVTIENITVENSVFGAKTTTMVGVFAGGVENGSLVLKNVKVNNVTVKAISKVGTYFGQAYGDSSVEIDDDCEATNVSIEVTSGFAGKIFGVLVEENSKAPTLSVNKETAVDDTVTVTLVKDAGVVYQKDSEGNDYGSDADAKDGVITTKDNNDEYMRSIAEYGFKGVRGGSYTEFKTGCLNKYNATEWNED